LEQGKTVILNYSIKSLDIEILIDLVNVLELNLKNDYEIMRKIFKDKSYLAIKDGYIIQTEDVIINDLERQILYYLSRR